MAGLKQDQLGAELRPPLSRGARWQLGLAVLYTLVWVALFMSEPWSGTAPELQLVPAYIPFLPAEFVAQVLAMPIYLLLESVSDDYFMEPSMNVLVTAGVSAGVLAMYFVLLFPLRLWIDRPGQRMRWAVIGGGEVLAYALACTLLLAVGGWVPPY